MPAILYSPAVQIGDAYAPSLNGAFGQIFAESGIKPVVKPPLGGQRTVAQELAIPGNGGIGSDHVKKRAVDIDNQRQLRDWNEARFLQIMGDHGWRNVTEGGAPFPTEPWHFANRSSTPAGGGGTPINNKKDDPTMYVRRVSTGTIALFNGTGQHDFSSLADYATHVSILSTYNAQAANAGDQQFVPPADPGQVMGLDETGWASMVSKYGAPVGGGTGSGPTVAQISDGVDAKLAPRFDAIPNAAQLGQALTSTVSLVNGHTDQLKVARTLPAIP